jgi:salicylate hydroxylase/6-hydroxynicotinate 3-monooxygenase
MSPQPRIAIIGAGIGGLALAGFLQQQGATVTIYEQARRFLRVGAGIQMGPNAMHVLRALGLEPRLRAIAFYPRAWSHRVSSTGEHLADLVFGAEAEKQWGAPYLLMHRGDLHASLFTTVASDRIAYEKKLVSLEPGSGGVSLRFSDGSRAEADVVIGADGVHSRVREILLGPERPKFTGRVAHRTTFPSRLVPGPVVDTCTKWWGPDRHIVIYPVTPACEELYFVTSVPDPSWDVESWSTEGETAEVVSALAGFHDEVQRVVRAAPKIHKWALFERDPLPRWTDGPIALLGDACHPMTPYMAQGAANALEDAAVLARCLSGVSREEVPQALRRYEATRIDRTARVQLTSRQNTWGKTGGDTSWVYGYNAITTPILDQREPQPA